MENPKFPTKDEIVEYTAEPTGQEDEFKSNLTETKLTPEISQDEPELKGWKAIQKTRKRRQYGAKQISTISNDESHRHHWRIEEVQGPISMGSCLDCSATREFKNWTDELDGFVSYERQYGTNKH